MALESKKRIEALIAEVNECYGAKATNLTEAVQALINMYNNMIDSAESEVRIKNNKVTNLKNYAFYHNVNGMYIVIADFLNVSEIGYNAFTNQSKLKALILRSENLCVLLSTGAFGDCGSCYFYVPASLIEEYKNATNWSYYWTRFRVLEDYTKDGTVTGEFDESKI